MIQGGLEIPCLLIFCAKNVYEAQKTKELLESSLKLPVQPVDVIPEIENILLGCELSDIEVNHAQHLIKLQFSHLTGLQSTLLQEKLLTGASEKSGFINKLQIIFCKKWKHWILATTIGCCNNEVKVYDSLFSFLDKDSLDIVENLYVKACTF